MKPLECMQIPEVSLPHELVQLLHFKRSRLFNFDLTSMEQTNDMFFPSMTSRYMEVGETFGMHANSCGDRFLIGSLMSLGGL